MALPDCLHCGQPGRRLDHTSAIAWTDFYRCDGCGQVWSSDGPAKRRTAKIVIAPKRPGRRSGKYPQDATHVSHALHVDHAHGPRLIGQTNKERVTFHRAG